MYDDSGTSDVEHADIECFAALPNDTAQATGLTENAVRKTIRDNQVTTDVVKYIRFTNVPPAVADKFSRCNTRQMFNPCTVHTAERTGSICLLEPTVHRLTEAANTEPSIAHGTSSEAAIS
ncbi:uncharacterized protein N7515_003851 [Penicillium bovifimosum]|uniref:Uncharacterized protein n=1 Tax=Penicillium bovifimosum TaxID=126998 RepID=A0A9W9L529_9EURO|nr:uncharacterized protein N7515_003851 [Penicillium bovifimosum]KAJ5139003.1 hypothetical protein N7515_003851 [Penicillium bovifimosum]